MAEQTPSRCTAWPSVTPVPFREVEGVIWRDGKPYCATHRQVVLVKAWPLGIPTDGDTHVCGDCARAAGIGRSEP